MAKYLPESGVHVDVLTARNAAAVGKDVRPLAELSADVRIHRTWALDLPFGLRKAIKKVLTRSGKPGAMKSAAYAPKAGGGGALKRMVGNLLLPDPQVGWLPFAWRAAKRMVRKNKIDIVVITVPPFSSLMLVSRLRKAYPKLPIVVDFRDEWLTTTIDLVSFNNNERARAIATRTEAEAVRDATAVVCVTDAAVRELKKRYSQEDAAKFVCIPNGFDRPLPVEKKAARRRAENDPAVLTYLGTVYGSTDPTPVVEAVLRLPEELRNRLRLRFIGHVETQGYRDTLQRLGKSVELIGFLPQAQALEYMDATDYLLLITHDPINVAAKLYDYLGSGRPIVAAVHAAGDVRRIVEETRTGWVAAVNDPEGLDRLLREAVERTAQMEEAFAPDAEKIAAYHRRPLAARYARLLESLMQGERAR
ncbi:MAG: glycosyltransferase [Acidobacteriota bacterium]